MNLETTSRFRWKRLRLHPSNWARWYPIRQYDPKGLGNFCLTTLVLLAVSHWFSHPPAAFAQADVEVAETALSKRNYPWYDAQARGPRPMQFPDRVDAKSADRDSIRMGKERQPTAGAAGARGNNMGLSLFAWFAIALVVAVIGGLLLWAFFRLESQARRPLQNMASRSVAESIEHLPFQVEGDSLGDFRALAQQAYQRGDFQSAIVYLFSYVLVTLDQRGLIRLRKGKTNRQYLRELAGQRAVSDFYQAVMVPFEATFFGNHELSQSDFEACWNQLDQFQDQVRSSQVVP